MGSACKEGCVDNSLYFNRDRVQNDNLDFSKRKKACIFVLILIGCLFAYAKTLK